MSIILKGLRERSVELLDNCERMLDVSRAAKRALTKAECREFDEKMEEAERLGAEIATLDREQSLKKRQVADNVTRHGGDLAERERRTGFNSWCRVDSPISPSSAGLALAEREGFAPDSRTITFDLSEVRAMGAYDSSKGQKAIPQGFVGALETALKAYGNVRSVARVIQTSGGGVLKFPTSNDTSNVGRILDENTQGTATDISVSELSLDAYKYSSDIVLVSAELLQDEEVDLERHIGEMLGERLGRITNAHFTTGTGSSQPNGVATASTVGKTAASATAVTYGELVDLQHSVDPAYQANATWMLNFSTLAALKKLVDGDNRPLWQASLDAGFGNGFPGTILGRPYVINQQMAGMTTGNKSILYGDFSKYLVREVKGVQLMRLNERYADYHQVAFLAYMRTDADLLDAGTHPIKALQQA